MGQHNRLASLLLAAVILSVPMSGSSTPLYAADNSIVSFRKATVKRQYKRAANLLLAAAKAGNSNAQYRLGILYRLGVGVKQDEKLAKDWLARAAGKDNKRAASLLAKLNATVTTPLGLAESRVPPNRSLADYRPPIDSNQRNEAGLTWLMRAAARGQAAQIPMLVKSVSQINAVTAEGETALLIAARSGEAETTLALLQAGADKEARDLIGRTPLMLASINGHEQVASALLDAGADVSQRDQAGNSSLLLAARNCRSTTIGVLLARGAEHTPDNGGETPLIAAAKNCAEAGVTAQLIPGSDINAVDTMGRSALWYAAKSGDGKSLASILAAGASPDVSDIDGLSPLLAAAAAGNTEGLSILLENGANPSGITKQGNDAAMLAAAVGCASCIQAVARKYQSIDQKNVFGETALMLAIKSQSQDTSSLLIAAGANPDARDKGRDTPRKLADRLRLTGILAMMK